MAGRSYEQYCALAQALDRIGDRWTLLIVRELLYLGPRRFTDLRQALPGIATNLLTARLRDLETYGLLRRRTLPPPAASTVYELTESGHELREAVFALVRWGLRFVGEPPDRQHIRPELPLMAFRACFCPQAAARIHESYELRIDDRCFAILVDDGQMDIEEGEASSPRVVLTTDLETFARIAMRHRDPAEAVASGALRVEGDLEALRRFLAMFPPPKEGEPAGHA